MLQEWLRHPYPPILTKSSAIPTFTKKLHPIIKPYPIMSRLIRITDPIIHIFRLLFSKHRKPIIREIQIQPPSHLFSQAGALSAQKDLHWLVSASFIINTQTRRAEPLILVNVSEYQPNAYAIMLIGQSGAFIYLDEFLQVNDLPFDYSNYQIKY
jgi:hypothetical protein